MAHCLIDFDKCLKFYQNISNGFGVIERVRFVTHRQINRLTDRWTGKNNMSPEPDMGRHKNLGCLVGCIGV